MPGREGKRMKKHNILSCIENAGSIMIAGHVRPDGDCVGSCMGLYHYIRGLFPDKKPDVRLEDVPESYRIIPDWEVIDTEYAQEKVYDLFIAVDVSEVNRLGKSLPYFHSAKHTICIDHHISNEGFADENHIEPDASSAAEVLAVLMDEDAIGYNAAFALYLGMICDSGVFKYDSTSRRTMDMGGMLMEKGIPFTQIINQAFYEKSFLQQRLLGRCLTEASLSEDGRIISCLLARDVMDEWGAVKSDLEGIVSQMLLTKGTEASIFGSENTDGTWKFSLRSGSAVDVASVASAFGGGGHVRAAGCTVKGGHEAALRKMKYMIQEQLHD